MASALKTLAGSDIVIVRHWHITVFTFLISFLVLFVFLDTFQPTTLLGEARDFMVPSDSGGTSGPYNEGTTSSDLSRDNKQLTDRGRTIVFAYSFGLGAAVGLLVYFFLVFYK